MSDDLEYSASALGRIDATLTSIESDMPGPRERLLARLKLLDGNQLCQLVGYECAQKMVMAGLKVSSTRPDDPSSGYHFFTEEDVREALLKL